VRLSTEEPSQSVKEYLANIGRKGGLKGGKSQGQEVDISETLRNCEKGCSKPMV